MMSDENEFTEPERPSTRQRLDVLALLPQRITEIESVVQILKRVVQIQWMILIVVSLAVGVLFVRSCLM